MSAADFDDPFDDPGYLESVVADDPASTGAGTAVIEDTDWLAGDPMDPTAEPPEPLPAAPGCLFLHAGAGALLSGPTGGGRSYTAEAIAYDAANAGARVAYLGSEVTKAEFNARSATLAEMRDDEINDELLGRLGHARYLNLGEVIPRAWEHPPRWVAGMRAYDMTIIDPLSAVASAAGLNFDNDNAEFVRFYDRLIQPLVTAGGIVVMLENIGWSQDAQARAKGVSAKHDKPDLVFTCKHNDAGDALIITAKKVRGVRAPFRRDDQWLIDRDTQTIVKYDDNEEGPTPAAPFRPTGLMESVSKVVEAKPGIGAGEIRGQVGGSTKYKDLALAVLIDEGYVEVKPVGPKNTHHSISPFREVADDGPCRLLADSTLPTLPRLADGLADPCRPDDGMLADLALTNRQGGKHADKVPDNVIEQPPDSWVEEFNDHHRDDAER